MENRPLDALNEARNKRVIVELKNNKQLIGVLKAFDIHINVVLEDVEERVEGNMSRKLGKAFVRGDTIILISPAWLIWQKELLLMVKSLVKKTLLDVGVVENLATI